MADKGLGHADVDGIHRHVIAVVGAPAKRHLGHIAGADDEPVRLVCKIHQNLCPLSGLSVLVGDVMHRRVMADVAEMKIHRLADVDLAERRPDRFGHLAGIPVGPVCRPERRHRHRENVAPVNAKQVERACRDEQRQRRVESARDADDRRFCPDMLVPLCKSSRLNGKNLLAARSSLRPVGRHKGMRIDETVLEIRRRLFHVNRNMQESVRGQHRCEIEPRQRIRAGARRRPAERRSRAVAGVDPLPVMDDPLHVHIRVRDSGLKETSLSQNRPVLGDEVLPGVDHVRSGFTLAGVRVNIGRYGFAGDGGDEELSVLRLADHLVRGGQIDDHRRARRGELHVRRGCDPHILAELRTDAQPADCVHIKQNMASERNLFSAERSLRRLRLARLEPPLLVKLRIIRQKPLRNERQNPSVLNGRRHIVEHAVSPQRKTHEQNRVRSPRVPRDPREFLLRPAQQRLLQEQIRARISRQHQLREHDNSRAARSRPVKIPHHRFRIEPHIRHPDLRRDGRHLDESVLHTLPPAQGWYPCIPNTLFSRRPRRSFSPRAVCLLRKKYRPQPTFIAAAPVPPPA